MSNRTSARAVSAAQVSADASSSSRRRGAILFAAAVATVGLVSSSASAQALYEPWDYGAAAVGTNYANTTGTPNFSGYTNGMTNGVWASAFSNAANDDKIFNDVNLQVSGLAAFAGDLAGSDQRNLAVKQPRVALQSGGYSSAGTTVYYSLAFRANDLGTSSATPNIMAGFNTATGTQAGTANAVGARLMMRLDPVDGTKYNLGIGTNTAVIDYAVDAGSSSGFKQFAANENLFVVGSYTFNGGAGDDVQNIWVNPSSASFGAATAPAPDASVTGGDISSALSFHFRTQNTNTTSSLRYDELRVDQTWAHVTPPAGSVFTAASSTDWSNSGSWNAGGVPNAGGAFAYFNNAAGGTVNVDTDQTGGTITIRSGNAYTIASTGGTLSVNAGTSRSAINVLPVSNPATVAASHTISAPISIANDVAVHLGTSQTLNITGAITGTGTISKDGPGTLVLPTGGVNHTGGVSATQGVVILSGTNSYTGPTSFIGVGAAGGPANILAIDGDAALGAVPGVVTNNLILSKPAADLILRFDAATTLNAKRTIVIANTGGGNGPRFDTQAFDVTVNGNITATNASNLIKIGSGTLFLRGDNSSNSGGNYFQTLFINGGVVNVDDDIRLGRTMLNGNPNPNQIQLNGGFLQFANSFTWKERRITTGSTGGGVDTPTGVNQTIDAVISGAAPFAKTGPGTLNLVGANTHTGIFSVKGGVLNAASFANVNTASSIGQGSVAGSAADLVLDGGTLQYTGASAASTNRLFSLGTTAGSAIDASSSSNAALAFTGAGTMGFSGAGARTLTLTGSSTGGNSLAAAIGDGAGGATAVSKTGGGTWSLDAATNTYTGGTTVNAGTLIVNRLHGLADDGSGTPNPVSITAGTLQVRESSPTIASGHPGGNNAFVSRPGSTITIANNGGDIVSLNPATLTPRIYNGKLDLTNNDLVIDYSATSPIADIEDMIRAGRNGGNWLGNGITSSTAGSIAAAGAYTLGVIDNATPGITPFTTFSGQTVDTTTVLVKFVHRSDINMDGVVTFSDSVRFNGNYSEGTPTRWVFGDLNYNGVSDFGDSVLFNGGYDEALASLPEPASLSLLGLAALGVARRRRRRA